LIETAVPGAVFRFESISEAALPAAHPILSTARHRNPERSSVTRETIRSADVIAGRFGAMPVMEQPEKLLSN